MSYIPYIVMALIPPEVSLGFDEVIDLLRDKYGSIQTSAVLEQQGNQGAVRKGDWELRLYWEDASHVLEESQEIAERAAAQNIDSTVIARCNRRITTAGDPDPDLTYFNDYVRTLEVLESIKDVYLFDPYDGKFIIE